MDRKSIEELPTFLLSIDPTKDGFVDALALTNDPAHKSMYLAFNEAKQSKQLFTTNDTKQEIIGAAIIPNQKILREPNKLVKEWHTVMFSADDIRLMAREFFKNGFQKNININHTDEKVSGYFFQSGIIGDEVGNVKVNGLDLPNGTWVLGAKIDDVDIYNKVKTYGYSVEGLFNYTSYQGFNSVQFSDEELLNQELEKLLKRLRKA
jgi:hypothetical protein